ncbi:MAG TPA: flagellar motor protein MotD [Hydrogenothermaceae bacterium]|nr:flagellar motor protein MotD [Hydrogenothermaceae bacterium]
MARKRRNRSAFDDSDSHERWLVSYADFVTLLFAFFVVMYSISSVNDEKYESLSDALEGAFLGGHKVQVIKHPIEVEQELTTIKPIILENPSTEELQKKQQLSDEILKERRELQLISEQFEDVLQPYVENDLVNVKRNDFWIELEMNSELLFLSGEAELSRKAIPVLKKIAEVIRLIPNVINIEGHTDNVPIDTVEFPSNWDLSSARATAVVREFEAYNISPKRLSAIGYGEFQPIADNNTNEGRFENRRVVLVLMSQAFARYGMNDQQRADMLNIKSSVDSSQ